MIKEKGCDGKKKAPIFDMYPWNIQSGDMQEYMGMQFQSPGDLDI